MLVLNIDDIKKYGVQIGDIRIFFNKKLNNNKLRCYIDAPKEMDIYIVEDDYKKEENDQNRK